jgi:hypothetical protein
MERLSALIVTTVLFGIISLHSSLAVETANKTNVQTTKEATDGNNRNKITTDIDEIKSYSAEKRDSAIKKSKELLDDFDARVERQEQRIEAQKTKWSKKIAEKWEKELAEMKKARTEMTARYGSLKRASKKSWEITRDAFINSYRKLEHKFDQLKSNTYGSEEEKHDNMPQ